MKNIFLILAVFFGAFFTNAQIITKILPPDGYGLDTQEMRPHYFDAESNTLFCSTKIYNDTNNKYENYIAIYNTTDESIEIIDSFFATSNVDWINYSLFKKSNNFLIFYFGNTIFRYNFNTQVFDTIITVTNLDGYDLAGNFLIYYTPGVAHFMDLTTDEVVTTYVAAYLDAFHVENDDIYFYRSRYGFSSTKKYELIKYNIPSNSFDTLFTNTFSSDHSSLSSSSFVKLGNNLIYTIQTANNTASYVSLDITTNTINTDFTFNVTTHFRLPEPFTVNNQVFITIDDDGETYASNGIDQPTLTTIGRFNGVSFVDNTHSVITYNNEAYALIYTDTYGTEVWKTDGQTKSLLKDIYPGELSGMSNYAQAHEHNSKLYFVSGQDVIYESDGTEEGTIPLFNSDLYTLTARIFHENMNTIYFYGESSSLGNGMFKLVPSSLSVEEFNPNLQQVNFYPNPASSRINFSKIVDDIKIYNTQGKLILTAKNTESINIEDLSSNSLYIIEYSHANKNYTKKLIITSE